MATSSTNSGQNPSQEDWKTRASVRKQRQTDSIPADWRITVPKDRQNVTQIPYECGLLTPLEIEITDTLDVDRILLKLHSGTWSSVQVTTAFYKRALIAHQTVRLRHLSFRALFINLCLVDQLLDGDIY